MGISAKNGTEMAQMAPMCISASEGRRDSYYSLKDAQYASLYWHL